MSAEKLPVFPLFTVLYPGAMLPLKIFETRYVDMVSQCLKTDTGFGVCLIKQGRDTGVAATCFPLGTGAKIVDWTQYDNGLLGITVKGMNKFHLLKTEVKSDNLLLGDIEWIEEKSDALELPGVAVIRQVYTQILENYDTPYSSNETATLSAAVLCYRLADLLALDVFLKQQILASDDLQVCVEMLLAVLKDADLVNANKAH